MPKAKLVRVLDEGTDMVFLIVKFEEKDGYLLNKKGWKVTNELTVIASIDNKISASMSTFFNPPYDIKERTGKMDYNHTTASLAHMVKNLEFECIPEVIDVKDFILR